MRRLSGKKLGRVGLILLAGTGLLALDACGPTKEAAPPPPVKIEIRAFGIPSAIVDYDVRGLKSGTERLYFDGWGTRQARYIHTKMLVMGLAQEENVLKIDDGRWSYTIDLPKATGIRQPNPVLQAHAADVGHDGKLVLKDEVMTDMGGRKAGSNNILGHTCRVWVVPATHTSYCLWKNIPLLTVMCDNDVEITTTAISINENVPVKDGIFKIPDSVTIRDAGPTPTTK